MELVLIGVAPLLTSGLTLLSGFGLGTILMAGVPPILSVAASHRCDCCGAFRQQPLQIWADGPASRLARVAKFSVPSYCCKR
ncbi:MAG: hypothetical protein ACK5NE_01815 [Brachymonas sp.]